MEPTIPQHPPTPSPTLKTTREQLRKKKLSEIEPKTHAHENPESREDLVNFVEEPLLLACQLLYDKNVQTYMSSANKDSVHAGLVEFSINYDALSDRNKKVAENLIREGAAELLPAISVNPSRLQIEIAVNSETSWGEIEDASAKVAERFAPQRLMPEGYSPDFLMGYLEATIEEDIPGDTVTPEYFERHGYFYEPETGLFFKGQSDRDRALQAIPGEDENEPPKFSMVTKASYE